MVYFFEKNHEYLNHDNVKYISVSGLIGEYEHEFEDEFNSIRSAFRKHNEDVYIKAKEKFHYSDPKIIQCMADIVGPTTYLQILENSIQIRKDWKLYGIDRSEYGTNEHSINEMEDTIRGYKINPLDGLKYKVIPRAFGGDYDNSYYIPEVIKMKENVVMLECLVTCDEALLAGQEDISFFKYLGAGQFGIINMDYKTDEEMEYKSFFNRGYTMMKKEMNFFMDSKFYRYALKQSMYALMQERIGCKIFGNFLKHIPENREPKYIKTEYYRSHAKKVLEKRITSL